MEARKQGREGKEPTDERQQEGQYHPWDWRDHRRRWCFWYPGRIEVTRQKVDPQWACLMGGGDIGNVAATGNIT